MPKPHRSFEEKQLILKEYKSGVSISQLSIRHGLSRTILYKWIKDPGLVKKNSQSRKTQHWKEYPQGIQRKIISYSLKHPHYSSQLVAAKLGLGHNGVWGVLKRHGLSTEKERLAFLESPAYQIKRPMHSVEYKVEVIQRYYNGESATKLCHELGISRTIFYQWLNRYREANQDASVFASHRPRKQAHWKFIPQARDRVLELARQHPEFSAHVISAELKKQSLALSHNTVHTILREQHLSRYQARLAFAAAFGSPTVSVLPSSVPSVQLFLPAPQKLMLIDQLEEPEDSFGNERIKTTLGFLTLGGIAVCMMLSVFYGVRHFTTNLNQKKEVLSVSQNSIDVSENENKVVESEAKPGNQNTLLAVNTDKNVYKVGDSVSMILGVVDENGNVECGAEIRVEVIGPESNKTDRTNKTYVTDIHRGETCDSQQYSVMPDYWTYFRPEEAGLHQVKVTAKTKDSIVSSNQQITVLSDEEYAALPYVIRRTSMPTRIQPGWTYRGEVQVEFHKDYSGVLKEKIDNQLRLNAVYTPEAQQDSSNPQQIDWNVQGVAGEVKSLVYSIGSVEDSPELYLLGPAELEMEGGKNNYTWQAVVSRH